MTTLIVVAFVIAMFVIVCGWLVFLAKRQDERRTEADILHFLKSHPEFASMYVIENGRVLVDLASDVKRPLASVLKIVIAVEMAEQAAAGRADPNERVSLDMLRSYYIPRRDGNAHPNWLKALDPLSGGDVSLLEVAKGMIHYSSNANTEFLIEKLGLDAINARISQLGMTQHDPIYPVSSSMLMYAFLRDHKQRSGKQAAHAMKSMTDREYARIAYEIFGLIWSNPKAFQSLQSRRNPFPIHRIWSARLPGATVKEYAHLLHHLQNGRLLSPGAHVIFKEIMERTPRPDSMLASIAFKGGSTRTILNEALYCEDKQGIQRQLVIFIHEPKAVEMIWLEKKLDLFLQKFLIDDAFRKQVIDTLGGSNEQAGLP